ncbi:hypothetical protein PRIPAC_73983 [Pristionchus pacificus]|uniref:Uncharacterized protein n=1 Tax=Pristionchus pacificus TaxID=54126 RepID=A0A2A6CAH4_PRIPA|nr:hypothetical protein PRIPAC_73983 [Pristionchus pacificus]|eukprot:PDM75053.1 hypothetical protein PRIPAC_40434 [Pristionchus pacificus]
MIFSSFYSEINRSWVLFLMIQMGDMTDGRGFSKRTRILQTEDGRERGSIYYSSNPFNNYVIHIDRSCYTYEITADVDPNSVLKTFLNCPPDATYCVKSFQQNKDLGGFLTFLETRNCANGQICQENGCVGTSYDQICCCNGNYCNGASAKFSTILILLSLVHLIVVRF